MARLDSELLYEILISTHRGSVERVADMAGVAYNTVHTICTDARRTAPVEIWKAAWLVTKDPRLKRLLEPDGFELVPRLSALAPTEDWERELGDVHVAASALHTRVREALADGDINRLEAIDIQRRIEETRVQLSELESLLSLTKGQSIQSHEGGRA